MRKLRNCLDHFRFELGLYTCPKSDLSNGRRMERYQTRMIANSSRYAILFFKLPLLSFPKSDMAGYFSRIIFETGKNIKWGVGILILNFQGYIERTDLGVVANTDAFMCLRIV